LIGPLAVDEFRGNLVQPPMDGYVVALEPDVARVFSNAETVNESLHALAGIIRRQKVVAKPS
jgi:hypothetical protein